MLSLFPQLLFLAPLGTTLLRVAAALCFFYMAWYFWQRKEDMPGLPAPIVGHMHMWMLVVSEVFIAITGVLLLLGAWAQVGALVGALICLKQLVFFRKYQNYFPFEKATYLLLFAICLMLAVTGAGAFAFDLPL